METTVHLVGVKRDSSEAKAFLDAAIQLPVVADWFKAHPSSSPPTQRLSFAFDHDSRDVATYDFRSAAWNS